VAGHDAGSAADFGGKTAFITAGAAGIGREIALGWIARGGRAFVTDRDGEALDALAAEVRRQGGRIATMVLDVRDRGGIVEAVATAAKELDGLDALFNVAGTNLPRNVEEIEDDEWHAILETNLSSVYRCSKQVIPHLRRKGGGAIVNVASVAGIVAENRCSAYTASKGGVVLLTKNMAMDFAKHNIRVNAICPGSTRTPRTERYWKSSPTGTSELAGMTPMRRSAEAAEIAKPALFLASSDASYITGSILVVDGGLTAGFVVPTFEKM
jgi:NAD(P)-dependent dehydrogenase (short-subunit alcohol dehydrogenase family)